MRILGGAFLSSLLVLICATGVSVQAQPPAGALRARVSLVIDGDTVVLDNGEHVRYLGIDTPEEGEPLYWAAKSFNRRLVWRKVVYLEIGRERRDGYGRLLAYIWVERDDGWVLVNQEILRAGLARLLVIWPDRYYERLVRALARAQVEKKGLWAKYKEPLELTQVEAEPLRYVTEAVTVVFRVRGIELKKGLVTILADGSRYGFHVKIGEEIMRELGIEPEGLVGKEMCVTGELKWENLLRGPYIEVFIPEQIGCQ